MKTLEWGSLQEFKRYLLKNEGVKTRNNSSHNKDKSWTGTASFEDAVELLTTGDKDIMEGIKSATKKELKHRQAIIRTYLPDVEGMFFDVAKVLTGEPEAWYKMHSNEEGTPIINIELGVGMLSGVSAQRIIDNAGVLLARVKELEMAGIQVGIIAVAVASDVDNKGTGTTHKVTIKHYDSPINYRAISAVAHPSFHRRLLFRSRELMFPNKNIKGYGRTVDQRINLHTRRSIQSIGIEYIGEAK